MSFCSSGSQNSPWTAEAGACTWVPVLLPVSNVTSGNLSHLIFLLLLVRWKTFVNYKVVQRVKVLLLTSGAYMVASLISAEHVCVGREDSLNIEFRVRKKDPLNLKVWSLRGIE